MLTTRRRIARIAGLVASCCLATGPVAAEGNEAAHLMTLTTTLSNGVVSKVRGIFTYRVNDAGKLTNLRGYWNMSLMEFTQPPE